MIIGLIFDDNAFNRKFDHSLVVESIIEVGISLFIYLSRDLVQLSDVIYSNTQYVANGRISPFF